MKHSRFYQAIVAIAMTLIGWLPSLAHDFEVNGIYYVFNYSTYTAEVSFRGSSWGGYGFEYEGSIVIPDSVTYQRKKYPVTKIRDDAFRGCPLTSVKIPSSVIEIGNCAFSGCSSLTSIIVDEENKVYDSRNNCNAIIETQSNRLVVGCVSTIIPNTATKIGIYAFYANNMLTSIEIPNSITSIGDHAFESCFSLQSIKMPSSVTTIGEAAFSNCENLTSFEIPNSIISIGEAAFSDCNGLTKIKIPNSVTSIETHTFENCYNLTTIEIPNSVTTIANDAFKDCNGLNEIICYATIPPSIYAKTFSFYSPKLYIPHGSKIVYDSADYWKMFSSIEEFNVYLDKHDITLEVTQLTKIDAQILPSLQIKNSITWSSIDENIAKVDATGNVTAIALGETMIVASIVDNYNISASCKVKVVPTIATSIALDKTEIVFEASEVETLVATVLPELTTNKSIIWTSSDESVAIVDENGKVTAIAVGETVVSATTIDGSNLTASCKVSVVPTLAESIVIDPVEVSMEATETTTLSVAVLPELTTDKSVIWKSSDESIAIVDNSGVVTAVSVGEAIITATTVDGSNLNASCKVIVVPTLAESIVIDKDEVTIIVPNSTTLVATILPELATDKSVVWTSSDESVAIVDEDGVITAVSSGQAVITATTIDGSNLSASCNANIIQLAESITLNEVDVKLEVTETTTLTATILPETTSNKNVVWTSSDESVAVVDENGVVMSMGLGETVITVATLDGTDLSATCRVEVVPTLAESITLDLVEITLEATETKAISVTVLPELTTDKTMNWKSSNEDIAIVGADGVVTAIAIGEAIITASTTDGSNLSATCMVTVIPTLAESIALDKTEISLEATETATLVAIVLPELATDKSVEWSSSNESVAIVDKNGVVTAISVGEATITATTADGSDLSASCKVTVVPTLAESITLDKTDYEIVEKSDFQLVATVLPELTTNKGVVWSSSDMWVASVDENGLVRAYSVGEAIITATTVDGSNLSASCKVTVISILAQSITLDKTAISLEATESITLIASVLPETTANKGIEWSSSDESVATIDANGLVTAVAVGEAIITAIATDGSLVSATCQVTVIPTLAMSIELDKTEASVEEKSEFQLTATILPEHTTNKEVAWSSSDKWVASVDNYGLVTMYSAGEVTITAATTDGTNLSATCRINVYSGIDGVNGDDVIVATVGDNIVVKNAKLGSVVNVYASNGALIASEVATDGDVVTKAPVKGVYVVKVGKQTVKVII